MTNHRASAREALRQVNAWLGIFGLDPRRGRRAVRDMPNYVRSLREFRRMSQRADGTLLRPVPALGEQSADAGVVGGHYFWQDLLVARRVFETDPPSHLDIGSRIDGLIAHLLVFRNVQVVDVRALDSNVPGLNFVRGDAMSLDFIPGQSVPSVSALHSLEHFGLGRYGDALDLNGHIRGLMAIQRVLQPGGRAWISFPIGQPIVEFNSQRIIDPELVPDMLQDLELAAFTAIPSRGLPVCDRAPAEYRNLRGWCGLYELRRPTELGSGAA